jgi:hypothetical protein
MQARQSQAFKMCLCDRTDLNAGELAEWNLFGGIVEEHPGEGCHPILAADQMCKGESDCFAGVKRSSL